MNLARFAVQFAANHIAILAIGDNVVHVQCEGVSCEFLARLNMFDQFVQLLLKTSSGEFVWLIAAVIFLFNETEMKF